MFEKGKIYGIRHLQLLAGLFIILSLSILGAGPVRGQEPVNIELLPSAEAAGLNIELGEVARLTGDLSQIGELEKIDLGSLPRPGYTAILGLSQVKYRLRQSGLAPEDYTFSGADRVEVAGKYQEVDTDLLEELLLPSIMDELCNYFDLQTFDQFPPETELVLEAAGFNSGKIIIPAGDIYLEADSVNSRKPWGRKSIGFIVYIEGREYKKVYRTFEIRLNLPVYVTKSDISHGQIINNSLLYRKVRDISGLHKPPLLNLDQIVGKEARRRLNRGTVLTADMLVSPPLVERGERVNLVVRYKAMRIRITVEALEDGFLNETVAVRNTQSGKVVQAVVKGPDYVYLELE
ncbi:MAG: flagellar basal body P-ring formation chaperone FlgA [Halanaerobium sp.]|nr:flagellar basal body P-ring formation chaperone FlgA [Halanaerobium sp.]